MDIDEVVFGHVIDEYRKTREKYDLSFQGIFLVLRTFVKGN